MIGEKKKEKARPDVEKKGDSLETKVAKLDSRLSYLIRRLEKLTGFDIDNDGKIGSARVAVLVFTFLFASALTLFSAEKVVQRYFAPEGDDAVLTIEADEGDDAADELQIIMQADGDTVLSIGGTDELTLNASGVTIGGTITATPSSGTVGTGVTATVTASETYGTVNKTVLAIADVPVTVTDLTGSTNSCGGVQVYDFPEGEIMILGFAVDDFTFKTNSVIDDGHGGDFAFGTTVGTGPDLSTTEIDLTDAKVSIDPIQTAVDALTELDDIGESRFDGTATAKDVYLNVLLDGGDIDADTTNTVDATVTIHWLNLGDD